MTRCAETGRVPPASGVIVNAVELPAGFRTVRIEPVTVVVPIHYTIIITYYVSTGNSLQKNTINLIYIVIVLAKVF